jgi:hypothetical protein
MLNRKNHSSGGGTLPLDRPSVARGGLAFLVAAGLAI